MFKSLSIFQNSILLTLQELKVAKTYIGAGLDACVTGNRDVIVGKNFVNNYQFIEYLDRA